MEGKNESKNTPETGIIPFLLGSGTLSGYWFDEDISPRFWWRGHLREYNTENETLRAEVDRIKNDLLDALDLKQGKGPTALSMLKNEVDRLTTEKKEATDKLFEISNAFDDFNKKYADWVATKELYDAFANVSEILTRIK